MQTKRTPLNPSGLCQCGCGKPAPIAPRTTTRLNYRKGEPYRYIAGHQPRNGRVKPGPLYRIDPDTGCWIWQRKITHGYGYMDVDGRTRRAHIVFYEAVHGPVPDGMILDHTCRNRACVNPDHLEPVTQTENVRRGRAARLDETAVAEIRRLLPDYTQAAIARQFGVDPSTISYIARHKTWR